MTSPLNDVDIDDSNLETEVTTAAALNVIVIDPLPAGCSYDLSLLSLIDLEVLSAECQIAQIQQKKIQHEQCLAELSTLLKQILAAGKIDNIDDLLKEIKHQKNSPDRLTVSSTNSRRTAKAMLCYRNPDNPSQIWSGHGRRPEWLKQQIYLYGEIAALEKCQFIQDIE